jgi:hypothetical protein
VLVRKIIKHKLVYQDGITALQLIFFLIGGAKFTRTGSPLLENIHEYKIFQSKIPGYVITRPPDRYQFLTLNTVYEKQKKCQGLLQKLSMLIYITELNMFCIACAVIVQRETCNGDKYPGEGTCYLADWDNKNV